MKPKTRRLLILLSILLGLGAALALILLALQENMMYYKKPSEIDFSSPKAFRLGGFVEEKSLSQKADGAYVFKVTDFQKNITVHYTGILPALFREGQGVIAEGALQNDTFIATTILAKHDENYRPPVLGDIKK